MQFWRWFVRLFKGLPTFFINFVKWDTELLSHWWLETSFLYFYLNPVGFFLSRELLPNLTGDIFAWCAWLWLSGTGKHQDSHKVSWRALWGMTTGSMVSSGEGWGTLSWYFTIQHDIQLSSLVNCDKHAFCSLWHSGCSKHPVLMAGSFPTFCTRTQTIASKSVA